MITRSRLNFNMPKHMKTKLIGTAVSPKPIVKSEDSKYKIEIMTEIKTEKHFQPNPLPASKHAEIPKDIVGVSRGYTDYHQGRAIHMADSRIH